MRRSALSLAGPALAVTSALALEAGPPPGGPAARPPRDGVPCTAEGPCDASGLSVLGKLGTLRRRLDAKLADLPLSVEDFRGAACAGARDDTCAIRATLAAACAAGSAEVRLSEPAYTVSGTLDLPASCSSVWFHGVSAQGTVITSTALAEPIVQVSGVGDRVGQFRLTYGGPPRPEAVALRFVDAASPVAHDFLTYNTGVGVKVSGGSALFLTDFQLLDHTTAGLWADRSLDVFATNFIINAGNADNAALGNVRLTEQVEAMSLVNGDVLLGQYALATDAARCAAGSRPAYSNFIAVYWDSAARGSPVNCLVASTFAAGWVSGGRSGPGYDGMTLTNSEAVAFTAGFRAFNNGRNGIRVANSSRSVTFTGGLYAANSVTAGAGVGHGISVQAGTRDFTVQGVVAGRNDLYPGGQQGYGILVEGGASDRYTIQGNLVSGNVTGGVSDGGTGSHKLVQGNW